MTEDGILGEVIHCLVTGAFLLSQAIFGGKKEREKRETEEYGRGRLFAMASRRGDRGRRISLGKEGDGGGGQPGLDPLGGRFLSQKKEERMADLPTACAYRCALSLYALF